LSFLRRQESISDSSVNCDVHALLITFNKNTGYDAYHKTICEEADYYPETTFSPEESSDAIEKAGKFIEIKRFFSLKKS